MSTEYQRVIPRDLFNESKLLKCMGRLCLLIHDGLTPVPMEFEHDGDAFQIALLDEGALTVANLRVLVHGRECLFKTTYNSKRPWPLFIVFYDDECEVFTDDGEWSEEFKQFCAADIAEQEPEQ